MINVKVWNLLLFTSTIISNFLSSRMHCPTFLFCLQDQPKRYVNKTWRKKYKQETKMPSLCGKSPAIAV